MITVSEITSQAVSNQQAKKSGSVVGKDDFLKLLVTQLQNQDPLNPMDSTEFTAQLAQFTSLEQMTNMNESLKSLLLYQASINNSQAVNFIGNDVVGKGNTVSVVAQGSPSSINFSLAKEAASVSVSIYDSGGRLIRVLEPGPMGSGDQTIVWDAKDQGGNAVSPGSYTYKVTAKDRAGEEVEVTSLTTGRVTGVTFQDGVSYLELGSIKIPIGDVSSVKAAPDKEENKGNDLSTLF